MRTWKEFKEFFIHLLFTMERNSKRKMEVSDGFLCDVYDFPLAFFLKTAALLLRCRAMHLGEIIFGEMHQKGMTSLNWGL